MGNWTEKQIEEMVAAVGSETIDPVFEREWIRSELAQHEMNLKQALLTFKFHKAMGQHEQMSRVKDVIQDTRNAIEYFQDRLTQLKES